MLVWENYMKHPDLQKTAALILAAASITVLAGAGEEQTMPPGPRLGLEVFDGGTPVRPPASRYSEVTPDANAEKSGVAEGVRDDVFAEPALVPQSQQPPYRAPDVRRPPIAPVRPADPKTESGESGGSIIDPFANLGEAGYPAESYGGQNATLPPQQVQRQPAAPAPAPYPDPPPSAPAPRPIAPERSLLDSINMANPAFPGLYDAVRTNSVPAASQIIWNTLRQRQAQGVYGYSTVANPQGLSEALMGMPRVAQDPLQAAQRVNVIIDSFQSPSVASPAFGAMMPQILTTLNSDSFAIQNALPITGDDGEYLELARTYVRMLGTCDFLSFSQRQIASDIRQIANRGAGMFYPDGSSRAGDVAGITGNLFHIMFMLDRYGLSDGTFQRDTNSVARMLERPGSFLSAVACPDGTLPNFGPRGTRELLPLEVKVIRDVFPRAGTYRPGLAGSSSYPTSGRERNYSGTFVMRDMNGRNGRFLATRFGPVGTLAGVPAHGDFGALVMMSQGVKYLADPGGYGGMASTPAAHGGVSLNGQYPVAQSYATPGDPVNAVWRTNASIDYLSGSVGYPDSKIWQRSIAYVKDMPGESKTDYWVVLDHVDMRDTPGTADITIRFPLAPGITAKREGPGVIMSGPNNNRSAMRVYAVDAGVQFGVGGVGQTYDVTGEAAPTSAVTIERRLTGSLTTATVFYPADDPTHRPRRIERDSDIIRGRTGLIVVDHGMERVDVIAWAPPKTELVTPTLNLQMSADFGVFRIRKGKIARVDFVNLERFQAKEPEGGLWSMRVTGAPQTLTIEKEFGGGWQVLSDADNAGAATLTDVNLGPGMLDKRLSIRPGEIRPVW